MTDQEIEKEVQARVRFKINELLTAVKNAANWNWGIAYDQMSQKHTHYWEAFKQLEEMCRKEVDMGCPYDRMADEKMRKAKNIAVDEVMKILEPLSRGSGVIAGYFINKVVSIIEKAQMF